MLNATSSLEAQQARFSLLATIPHFWGNAIQWQSDGVVYGDLFGNDVDLTKSILGDTHTYVAYSKCSNESTCTEGNRVSLVKELSIPIQVSEDGQIARNQAPDISSFVRNVFTASSTGRCTACQGIRTILPLRYGSTTACPPLLVLALGDFAGPNWDNIRVPDFIRPFEIETTSGHPQYDLVGVTYHNQDHYTMRIRVRGVWYFYDDLWPKSLRRNRKPIGKPSLLIFARSDCNF